MAGRSYTVRVGSPAAGDGAPFSLEWRRADAPAWLGFAGSFADAPDAQGRSVRLMDAGSLAFGGDDGDATLYAVSATGLAAFERDSATGSLNGVRTIEDDLRGSVLVADPVRNRLIANRCGTWRAYTGLDDAATITGDELPVEGDPANCARRLFAAPGGAFLYLVAPGTGIEVFAVEDDGGLRHEATTQLEGIKDAVISRSGEFVYAADLDGTTHLRTFGRDGDSGLLTQRDRYWSFFALDDMDSLAIAGDDFLFATRRSSGLTVMYELADGVLTVVGDSVSPLDAAGLPVEQARPFEFTSARPETTAVDVFGASVAAGLEIRQGRIDLLAHGGANGAGSRAPLFGTPNGLASSPDGRHVYVATYDHGIVAFERIGAGVDPADPHVRLGILSVSSGLVSFGGETDSDGCIAVDGLEHDGTRYTVRSSKWQRRPNADWDWSDVAGTAATGEVCPHTPSEPGHYRLVAEIEVDGEAGRYASDVLIEDDHGDSTGGATAVGVPSATAGWLEPDDADYFQIELAASGTLTVYTEGWTDTEGRLLDGGGETVASDGDGGDEANFRISRNVDAGTYYVRVRGSSGAQGDYTLHAAFEAAAADLVVASATLSATPAVGETFTLDVVVRNDGDGAAAATTLRYYRSDDSAISTSDEEIGTNEVAALDAGASSAHSIEVTVEEAGSYRYGACVDAVDGESDTANNCSAAATEPSGGFQLDADNSRPEAIEYLNGRLLVVDGLEDKVYVYSAAGERRAASDFGLDAANSSPRGIVHVDGLLYVVDDRSDRIYVYTTAGERRADLDVELDAENADPDGIAHADGLLYVGDWLGTDRVYVYTTSGERREESDFDLARSAIELGIAHRDGTLYVTQWEDRTVYGYTISGERRADADFQLDADNSDPEAITSANGRFYLVDGTSDRVSVYTGDERGGGEADDHGDTFATATTVSIPSSTDGELEEGGDKDYFRLEVAEATTLTVETSGSTDTYGTLFDGDETSLETDDDGGPGTNFRIERDVQAGTYYVEVRGFGSSTTGSYELGVGTAAGPASGFGLDAENSFPKGVAYANGLLYVADGIDDKVYVYATSGERRAAADFDLDAENSSPERLAHADGLIYVVDATDDKTYVYTTSGQRRAGSDFDLDGHGRWTGGIAHADGLLYVLDWDVSPGKVYVYTTSGQRRAGSDFDLQAYRSGGIAHADGLLYLSTWSGAVDVHAYTTSGERRPDDDFDLEPANRSTQGIDYGDGRFYVLDDADGRVFVYESGGNGDSQQDVRSQKAEEAVVRERVADAHALEKDRRMHSLLMRVRETERQDDDG